MSKKLNNDYNKISEGKMIKEEETENDRRGGESKRG
jgi:hypothetical protein